MINRSPGLPNKEAANAEGVVLGRQNRQLSLSRGHSQGNVGENSSPLDNE